MQRAAAVLYAQPSFADTPRYVPMPKRFQRFTYLSLEEFIPPLFMPDDALASIKVREFCRVTLFEDAGAGETTGSPAGGEWTVTTDQPDSTNFCEGCVSSLEVFCLEGAYPK